MGSNGHALDVSGNRSMNPFSGDRKHMPAQTVRQNSEAAKAQAEIQGMIVSARKFPRDQEAAMDRILQACNRPSLAEQAIYSYPRGGQTVSGPSINLARAIAQQWGNIDCGVREIERREDTSLVEAYAWDLETNYRSRKEFTVKHWRDTKSGGYPLDSERDIYELIANMGARRLRACILSVIPSDVVERAVEKCNRTNMDAMDLTDEDVEKMVKVWGRFGVTREMLERNVGRELQQMTESQYNDLLGAYNAIKNDTASVSDFFSDSRKPKQGEDADSAPTQSKPANVSDIGSQLSQPPPADEDQGPDEPESDESGELPTYDRYGDWTSARKGLGQMVGPLDVEREQVEAAIASQVGVPAIEHVEPAVFAQAVETIKSKDHAAPEGEPSEREVFVVELVKSELFNDESDAGDGGDIVV